VPFVRFSRDRRGYEHIYLVHAAQGRGRSSGPTKVLYWYRTPPGLKVGREPFDETARRALEAEYPNLQFDWKRIVTTPMPPAEGENWREKRRLMKEMRAARADEAREPPSADAAEPVRAEAAAQGAGEHVPRESAPAADVAAAASLASGAPHEGRPRRRRRGGRRRHRDRGTAVVQAPGGADQGADISEPYSEPVSDPYSESASDAEPETESDVDAAGNSGDQS